MAKSNLEDKFASYLDEAGVEYERQFKFHPDRRWKADFRILGFDILVEINGGIFLRGGGGRHNRGAALENEYTKLNAAQVLGYKVFIAGPNMLGSVSEQIIELVKNQE